MNGDFPFLEFPFDAALLAQAERQRVETAQRKAKAAIADIEPSPRRSHHDAMPEPGKVEHAVEPRSLHTGPRGAPQPRGIPASAWVFLAVSLLAAAALGFWLFPGKPLSAPQPSAPAIDPNLPPPSIGLEAGRQNGDLRLTWKRDSAAITGAVSGVLSIQDGDSRQEIHLATEQVRSGSILYTPLTNQVRMRLTVSGPDVTAAESVIVINPLVGKPQTRSIGSAYSTRTGTRPPTPSGSAPRTTPLKAFVPPAAGNPAPPATVVDAPPPSLQPNTDPGAAGAAAILSRLPRDASRPPAVPAPVAPPAKSAPAPVTVTFYPPQAIHTVSPAFPAALKSVAFKPVTVEVIVSVDEAGKVRQAEPVPQKGVHPLLFNTAVGAARQWRFQPARRGSQPIPGKAVLRFVFSP